jgi:hypothetical protein
MWRALEPIHAVTYFAPEPQAACTELGTKGYWMSYFAQRAAPLGPVPPEIITALFYNFAPRLVARAVPDTWAVATPERYLQVRQEAVDAALHRMLGAEVLGSAAVAEAAEIAAAAVAAAPTAGRALGAANAALPVPAAPHMALWHAQTVLRELRGDGHVAVLLAAGVDPVEALVVFAADEGLDGEALRTRRGWTPEEWTAAGERLAARGLLDGGLLTAAGRQLRAEIETRTDALADVPWAVVGDAAADRLVELADPLVAGIVAAGGFMVGNPMGLRTRVAG